MIIIKTRAIIAVTIKLISTFDPISCSFVSVFAPDKNLTNALLVIPNRNISTKDPPEIKSTHLAKDSVSSPLANKAKPANPIFPKLNFQAKDRRLSSWFIFDNSEYITLKYAFLNKIVTVANPLL